MLSTSREVLLDSSAFLADKNLIEALERVSSPVHCQLERALFHQGDEPVGIYILRSGRAILTMQSPSGEQVLHLQAGPGSVLGLPGLLGNTAYSLTAIAQAGAEVGFVTSEDFHRLMAREPALSLKVLQVLAAEVHNARRAIFDN